MATETIVLITGGNTGLGFETVKALFRSKQTYTVLLGGRSIDKANAAVKAIKSEFPESPSNVTAIQIDIEDDDSISRALDNVTKSHGRVDVLINNAGKFYGFQETAKPWLTYVQAPRWITRCTRVP